MFSNLANELGAHPVYIYTIIYVDIVRYNHIFFLF